MQAYCDKRVPKDMKERVKLFYKIRGNNVTLIESQPVLWSDPESIKIEMKIAQIRFNNDNKSFTLYYADRNDRWHLYDWIEPSTELEDILQEIDRDPTGIFWG